MLIHQIIGEDFFGEGLVTLLHRIDEDRIDVAHALVNCFME